MTMFATPLDQERVMVRRAPETYLWVREVGTAGRVEVSVDLRASHPPLRPAEVEALRSYFEWPKGRRDHDWYTTARPAYFRLLRVREDVYVGRLEQRGRVEGLSGTPAAVPRSRGEELRPFRVYSDAHAAAQAPVAADPRVLDAHGRPQRVYRSAWIEGWLARFPRFGPEEVWLRAYAEDAYVHFDAQCFQAEARVLRLLEEHRPGAAVRVAHLGTLDVGGVRGPYLATTVPIGVEPGKVRGGKLSSEEAWQLAADLLLTLAAVHRHGVCLGGISPALLRVRPSYLGHRPVLRAMLAAAPLAGPMGEPVQREDRHHLPADSLPPRWPESATVRSAAADVADVGRLLARMLDGEGDAAAPLRAEAAALVEGRAPSAGEALERLSAGFPGARERFLGVLRPRSAYPP